jgi:transcriptional regulator with XRE-family HTH domain
VLCIVVLANYLIVLKGEILLKDYESLGIGRVIESLRRGKQMTQEDLAEKAGLEPNTISRIERDDVVPSYLSILNIGRALNLTPMEFGEKIQKYSKVLDYYRQD